MKTKLLVAALCFTASAFAQQKLEFPTAKFKVGDDMVWRSPDFDDSRWNSINTFYSWEMQGYDYNGFAWYRIRFTLPREMRDKSYYKDWLHIYMAKIDDADETYLNGKLIGKTGAFPGDSGGYTTAFTVERNYKIAVDDPILRWGEENVIAVRVYDDSGIGGIGNGTPRLYINDLIDMLTVSSEFESLDNAAQCRIVMKNDAAENQKGQFRIVTTDTNTGKMLASVSGKLNLTPGKELVRRISYPKNERIEVRVQYTDGRTGKQTDTRIITPYILTPPPAPEPRINSPRVFGVRPSSPILFKVAASGEKPLVYSARNLPENVTIDPATGVLEGSVAQKGDYDIEVEVSNARGKAVQHFVLKVGDKLSLTPPMGWNSWNCWGESVTQEKVAASARALIDKGLIDYGWSYINIDDVWQAKKRTADGRLLPGPHFPDIRDISDWLHSEGLKLGIYSSPGPTTCAHQLGSWGYEALDAATYAEWGIDYLKYDWCGYDQIFHQQKEMSITAFMKPYLVMERELRKQDRDIVYSICQYGMRDVWQWGEAAGGNCWRTTEDIVDTWESLRSIAMRQRDLADFAKPGHWNDPDMLVIGKVGWGPNLHPTRLTVDEQYLHVTLWNLLASPLLIGCDLAQIDDFTLGLLTNPEVNEVNQDPLGKQARVRKKVGETDIWVKEMEDGSHAVGIVNWAEHDVELEWNPGEAGLEGISRVRDLWRRTDVPFDSSSLKTNVPKHGAVLYRFY